MTTYHLSVPPSVNQIFVNVPGKGRVKSAVYRKWIKSELVALMSQRAKPVVGRASVSILLPRSTPGDIDNRLKGTLDLLVRAEILPDDSGKYVGALSVTFADVPLMHVTVEPMAA